MPPSLLELHLSRCQLQVFLCFSMLISHLLNCLIFVRTALIL
jgi:hypothetical protein